MLCWRRHRPRRPPPKPLRLLARLGSDQLVVIRPRTAFTGRRHPRLCTRPGLACRRRRLAWTFVEESTSFGSPQIGPAPTYTRPPNDSKLSCDRRPLPAGFAVCSLMARRRSPRDVAAAAVCWSALLAGAHRPAPSPAPRSGSRARHQLARIDARHPLARSPLHHRNHRPRQEANTLEMARLHTRSAATASRSHRQRDRTRQACEPASRRSGTIPRGVDDESIAPAAATRGATRTAGTHGQVATKPQASLPCCGGWFPEHPVPGRLAVAPALQVLPVGEADDDDGGAPGTIAGAVTTTERTRALVAIVEDLRVRHQRRPSSPRCSRRAPLPPVPLMDHRGAWPGCGLPPS